MTKDVYDQRDAAERAIYDIYDTLINKDGQWGIHHEQDEKLKDIVKILRTWRPDLPEGP